MWTKEQRRKYVKNWRKTHSKQIKNYRQTHKEEQKNYTQKWRKLHPEEWKKYWEQYKLRHPEMKKIKRKYDKKYHQLSEVKKRNCLYLKKLNKNLRLEVLVHYGGNPPKCACCGEEHTKFLTIDHINNDGAKWARNIGWSERNRSGIKLYAWLKRNNYPEEIVQVLCYNCNCGKTRNNGICPHKGDID